MSLIDNNAGIFDIIWEQIIAALVINVVDFVVGLVTGFLPAAS